MEPPGIYPIIVVITGLRWAITLLTWKRGWVNYLFISGKERQYIGRNEQVKPKNELQNAF